MRDVGPRENIGGESFDARGAGGVRGDQTIGADAHVDHADGGAVAERREALGKHGRPGGVGIAAEAAPSVMESPKATITWVRAGASTCRPETKKSWSVVPPSPRPAAAARPALSIVSAAVKSPGSDM